LLYDIGFVGLQKAGSDTPRFRSLGPADTTSPPVSDTVDIIVHQCYWAALDLQDIWVRDLNDSAELGRVGRIVELPGGLDPEAYYEELDELYAKLQVLPTGTDAAREFEDIVGDVIRLCFFRALVNVEPRVRDVSGRVVRDWMAANRAQSGFWESMRLRYGAVQVTWECKNYEQLNADDFHQASYYANDASGRLVMIAYRGREVTPVMLDHIRRIHTGNRALVFPLGQRDLLTFLRQARNGKIKEDHIQDRYDHIIRRIA